MWQIWVKSTFVRLHTFDLPHGAMAGYFPFGRFLEKPGRNGFSMRALSMVLPFKLKPGGSMCLQATRVTLRTHTDFKLSAAEVVSFSGVFGVLTRPSVLPDDGRWSCAVGGGGGWTCAVGGGAPQHPQ